MIVINSSTRQFNIPGADMTFGVEADAGSERKYFQCPRYVGNNLDIASCFVRINYRNANGDVDSYLVEDLTVDDNNVLFSWELYPKVTAYKGQIKFVMCVTGPDTKVAWHTTLGTGIVLEGLEPEYTEIQAGTADVVAQLIAMVNKQTTNVEETGAAQVAVVKAAAKTAQDAAVAEIEAKGVNTRNSIPEDYTSLENTVDGLVRSRAGAIVCEVAGSMVAVNDASDMKIQGLKIFGRSTQNGIPSPDAPVEIVSVENPSVAVFGKNLLNTDAFASSTAIGGFKADYEGDGIIHVYGTSTQSDPTAHVVTELAIPIDANKNYTLHTEVLEGKITGGINMHTYLAVGEAPGKRTNWLAIKLDSTTPVGEVRHTIGAASTVNVDAKFLTRFWVYVRFPSVGDTIDIRVRVWLTATDAPVVYEPYKSFQTIVTTHPLPGIPVTSGGNYIDSQGQQWLCDEVDLERGVLIKRLVTHVLSGSSQMYVWTDTERERGVTVRNLPMDYSEGREALALCSHYLTRANGSIVLGQIGIRHVGDYPSLYLLHEDGIATSLNEWKAFFDAQIANGTPVTVLVKAEQEIEVPISETEIAAYRALHSNYGNTTVLNDAGAHMVVKYAADTKLYIDNKIAALVRG